MDFAEKVLQLKQDFDDVYEAGKAQGGGGDVIDFPKCAKYFQFATTEGLPETITVNLDYQDTLSDFWSGVINTNVKHIILNVAKKLRNNGANRVFNQTSVNVMHRALEHITFNADLSGVTSCTQVFYMLDNLKIVDGTPLDFSSATSISALWLYCMALEEIRVAKETIKVNMTVQADALSVDSLLSFLYGLYDYSTDTSGTSHTLTMGTANLNKLTDTQKAIATEKGWNLA